MDSSLPEPNPPEPNPPEPNPPEPEDDNTVSAPLADSTPSLSAWFRSLYRSDSDRLLGGVAGGMAERFAFPVLVVRMAFVVAALVGVGVPLYVLAWILLPDPTGRRVIGQGRPLIDLLAIGAVVVAGLALLSQVGDVAYPSLLGRAVPWFVILGGLALVLRRETGSTSMRPPSTAHESLTPAPPTPPIATQQRRQRVPRPRPFVGPVTWCVALIVLGVLGAAALGDPTSIGPGVMAAVMLLVFGGGLLVSAFRGRARGLLLPVVALGGGLALLGAADVRADNVAAPFDLRVRSAADLEGEYTASFGSSTLDLADLDLDGDRTVVVRSTAGRMRVILPRATGVIGRIELGTGNATVSRVSGMDVSTHYELIDRWLDDGLPADGDPLTESEIVKLRREEIGAWATVENPGRFSTAEGNGPVLNLRIEMGLGNVDVIDPHWTNLPDRLVQPTQLCTVAGGTTGVVVPCEEVPNADRIPVCFAFNGEVIDCREAANEVGSGLYLEPVCRAADGSRAPCSSVGIDPVGVPDVGADGKATPPDPLPTVPPLDSPTSNPTPTSVADVTTTTGA